MKSITVDDLIFHGLLTLFFGYLLWMVIYFIRIRRKRYTAASYEEENEKDWIKTTGIFTGRTNYQTGMHSKSGTYTGSYTEYEVLYYVDGEAKKGWYHFHPAPDLDVITEKLGVTVRYSKRKPWEFEVLEIHFPDSYLSE